MDKERILGILVIVAIFFGIILSTVKPVEKKGLVAKSDLTVLSLGPKGEIMEGWWKFVLSVDSYDTLEFTLKPENIPINQAQQYSGPQLPPGSTLNTKKAVKVTLKPLGNPWAYGQIQEYRWVYDDFPETGFSPIVSPQRREMAFWRMTGSWISVFCPYKIEISRTGEAPTSYTALCGPSPYGQDSLTMAYGIRATQLGMLPRGVLPPAYDFSYIYLKEGEGRFVQNSQLDAKLSQARLGSFTTASIRLVDANQKTVLQDTYYKHEYSWGWPIAIVSCKTELWVREGATIEFYHTQSAAFRSTSYVWTFEITGVQPDANVEWVSWEQLPGGLLGEGDVMGLIDETGKHVSIARVVNNKFKFKYYGESGTRRANVRVRFKFYSKADTWNEAVVFTGLQNLPEYKFGEERPVAIVPASAVSLCPFTDIWTPETSVLYRSTCPETSPSAALGSIYPVQNKKTVICKFSPLTFSALVTLEVPVAAFDSWVYIPPYGKPEVVDVSCETLEGGKRAWLVVKVKNVGLTPDTFVLKSISLPPNVLIEDWTYAEALIEKDETKELKWGLTCGEVKEKQEIKVTGEIIAKGSLERDSFDFTLKLVPGVTGPPLEIGSLTISVIEKKTGNPVEGAEVFLGKITSSVTDETGQVVFSSINAGEYTIRVSKKGFISAEKRVTVRPNMMNYLTIELSVEKEELEVKPLWIIVPLVIVTAITSVFYWWYKKRRRK